MRIYVDQLRDTECKQNLIFRLSDYIFGSNCLNKLQVQGMSVTSIQDEGFTPPDFMEKLFKRTSTSSSDHLFKPYSTLSQTNTNSNYFQSMPLIPFNDTKYSPSKLHRANSLNEEERISTKKFKIFYNTILEDVYPEIQSLEIWQRFEKCLNNPFQYDKFIEDLRLFKEKQKVQTSQKNIVLSELNVTKLPQKSNSLDKFPPMQKNNSRSIRSVGKKIINKQLEKQKARNAIRYARNIMRHGERYIKQR